MIFARYRGIAVVTAAAGSATLAKDPAPKTAASAPAAGKLGRLNFPVTGGEVARRHFVRGLLALHSFWYEEARDEFREAMRAQPDFVMGRWGEALTYFQPIWRQEDVAAEKKALNAVAAQPPVTARELAYLEAARTLIAEGDFASHAARYRDAMRSVHQRFPADDEATALYSVAIRNPDHPGAAHYIIHAFDDPEHARLALPAARRYAQIAPEAFHALHMPSHIFVHLGIWTEAAVSNESSWSASLAWVARKKLDSSLSDGHSLSWLHAIYLELGQHRKANEVLERDRDRLAAAQDDRAWLRVEYLKLLLKNALETDSFTDLEDKLAPLGIMPGGQERPATAAGAGAAASAAGAGGGRVDGQGRSTGPRGDGGAGLPPGQGDRPGEGRAPRARVSGPASRREGEAADLEDRAAPSGPIETGVSGRERLGELLLGGGRPRDALREFRRAPELHPRRARVLLGCARAAAAAGDQSALSHWAELASVWAHADEDTPGLAEMRRAMASTAQPRLP